MITRNLQFNFVNMLRPTSRLSSAASIAASHSRRQVIFSGIQPTGVPHLGNYLGALRQWVKLQDEAAPDATLLYSVVDLHAITVLQDPARLRQWRKEMFASLIAVGLDPKRSIIFCQSSVPAHSELMWILSCTASMGYLSRMTQWKARSPLLLDTPQLTSVQSKLALPDDASPLDTSAKAQLRLGLFSYPVLQAADVLVHRYAAVVRLYTYSQLTRSIDSATHVPVGEDQSQHLEFARNCANAFNHNSDKVLVPPETILCQYDAYPSKNSH
jgi:tryptophanyl-tRNA synthetase